MNSLVKNFTRRVPGIFARLNKYYHSSSCTSNPAIRILGPLNNEQSICRLVQKTIIPLNIVTPKPAILDMPCTSSMGKLDYSVPEKIDREPEKIIIDPGQREEKKAHRMLIIRRKKLNKHFRVKRWRKNKFLIAKIHRERRMDKEVRFRQEIATQLKEAENFNAEEYVAQKLEMFRKEILPNRLYGKLMPAFVIEDHIAKKKLRQQRCKDLAESRKRLIQKRGTLDVDIKS